jgi:transcriptional regulator with XRE-family HTH domain
MGIPVGPVIIEGKPDNHYTGFMGRNINVSAIARSQGINQPYLSLIFQGKREPSITHARKICAALGMGLEEFLEGLDERRQAILKEESELKSQYLTRITREDEEDLKTFEKGRIPKPRNPALRLK